MEHSDRNRAGSTPEPRRGYELVVLAVAAVVYLGSCVSPPGLMDDVDAVQAQIGRTMLDSGDWVTARLDGVVYLEKSPFVYWMMAVAFKIFGTHDWAARLPLMLATMALCWTTQRFTAWAFGERAGFYAGLISATSLGLFLFTRILIPDSTLTLTIALSMWAFLRTQDDAEPRSGRWAALLGFCVAIGVLLKGLIAAVFPAAAIFLYWTVSGQLFSREAWRRVRPVSTAAIMLAVAAPWFVIATLRNPPYFDFTLTSGPGNYRGFFWFYFFNEHILRFLNRRYPRDYNTVPRLWFWTSHLVWFFPWSAFLGNLVKLNLVRRPTNRAGRTTLLAVCWIGFVMVFFTLSTTQEYYSLPIYPAVAMLLGVALTRGGRAIAVGKWITSALATVGALAIGFILYSVRNVPTPGDIAQALKKNTDVYDVYTLSLGHMGDLTLGSFAYLRVPLVLAGIACLVGAIGVHLKFRKSANDHQPFLAVALMLTLFLTAARVAMVGFDPYLGSRPLAETLRTTLPQRPGTVIADNQYYAFSSVFFYADLKNVLLLNGRTTNLEYGSNAPGAPAVFIDDAGFRERWLKPERAYLLLEDVQLDRMTALVGKERLHVVKTSGGKFLFTNLPDPGVTALP